MVEIEEALLIRKNYCCYEIESDINSAEMDHNLKIIGEAREQICKLAEKYNISKQRQSLRKLINAKRARTWEILCDVKARKQKGYGEFPKELIKEYDTDIGALITITDKIKI